MKYGKPILMLRYIIVFLILIGIVISCRTDGDLVEYSIIKEAASDSAMVVSAHPIASDIGINVLKQGGNAVDAAIAVQFALAVCYPVAGNIGGGGFMVLRTSDGEVSTLDFREKAPALAHETMYQDSIGNIIEGLSTQGHLAAGVPGSVAGMWEAYNQYSKLKDWHALIQPAINIAKIGFHITQREADGLNKYKESFEKANVHKPTFIKETEWKKGDLLVQSDLANTLTVIKDNGRDGFYKGWVADKIVEEMKAGGGIISHKDLETYEPKWRSPISMKYKGYKIYTMPPPSSGGIALAQILESIERFNIGQYEYQSPPYVHLIAEAERRAYADRTIHLGDSDYFEVPIANLLDSNYIASRMANFDPNQASVSDSIEPGDFESEQTTHFSIVDQYGNAVSLTTTINTAYGSKVVVNGAGFLLNNEMDDFSAKPGVPNYFGLLGAEANKIEAGKRMLSSMTPSIVTKDDNLFMVVGTPGGSTIITSVLQTILNVIEYDMTAYQAVASPRFHHQWLPDQIFVEKECLDTLVRESLINMGHKIEERSSIGKVEAIIIKDGKLEGGADPRGDDSVAGF